MFARSQLGAVWRQTQEWNSRQVSSMKENMHPDAPEVHSRRRSVGSPFHPSMSPGLNPNLGPFSPNLRPAPAPAQYPAAPAAYDRFALAPAANPFLQYGNGPVRVPAQPGVPFMPDLPTLAPLDERGMFVPAVPTVAPQLLQ
jgi:hypothetical protein